MKSSNLQLIFILALCTGFFASCSKNDGISEELAKQEAKDATASSKLKTMDDDCTKTESVASIDFGYNYPTCGNGDPGETITESITWEVTEVCGNTTTYTYPVSNSTLFSKGCDSPPTNPLPYPFPTRIDGYYVSPSTIDFVEDNIEYFNASYLAANPSILQALRDVGNNASLTNEVSNVDPDDKPGDPYVRDQIYWAMFGVLLSQQIGTSASSTLINNVTSSSYFSANALPAAFAKSAAFASYYSTDMPSGGLPELRAWLENRMQQGSF